MCNLWCLEFARLLLPHMDAKVRVLEVGSRDVNGSARTFLSEHATDYVGVDICDGMGVDKIVDVKDLSSTFDFELFDVVISTEMLEHCEDWQEALFQMVSVLSVNGILLITTRSPGFALHDYPADHWRFSFSDFEKIFSPIGNILALENDMTLGWPCGVGVILRKKASFKALNSWHSELKKIDVHSIEEKSKASDSFNHTINGGITFDQYRLSNRAIFGDQNKMIFDIYSRHKACSDLLRQTDFVVGDSILDVGSGPECLFGQFVPDATMNYIDPLIPGGSRQGRISGDIFSHELNNQVFDCVSAVDVLEHVPPEHRQAFLGRVSSLAKSAIILGFPTSDSSEAHETDQVLNKQYRAIFGQDYPWLDEHFRFGLPSLCNAVDQLEKLGWYCQTIGHGHAPWLRELLGFVICTWDNPKLKKMVLDISQPFKRLYPYDFRAPHYRQFIVASRNQLLPVCPPEIIGNEIDPEHIFQAVPRLGREDIKF